MLDRGKLELMDSMISMQMVDFAGSETEVALVLQYTCGHLVHCDCAWAEEEESRIRDLVRMGAQEGIDVAVAGMVPVDSNFADTVRPVVQIAGEVDWDDYSTLHQEAGID